jgi:hypothetical protein
VWEVGRCFRVAACGCETNVCIGILARSLILSWGGLLGSLGPADRSRRGRSRRGRSRRGRKRCDCRQKDKAHYTTEYCPGARSDRRRSSASCLGPANCGWQPPGSPVSTADLAPALATAVTAPQTEIESPPKPHLSRRRHIRAVASRQSRRKKQAKLTRKGRPYRIRGSQLSSANFHLCRRALESMSMKRRPFLFSHAAILTGGHSAARFF